MNRHSISIAAVLAALAIAPSAAVAGSPATPPSAESNGIIAILIGQAQAQPFTPPIGTGHGS